MRRLRFPNLIVVVVIVIGLAAASSGFVASVSIALTSMGLIGSTDPALELVPSSGPTVTELASSDYASCALLDTGGIKCWGQGPLGTGPGKTQSSKPVDVKGISDATSIAGGGESMCAIVTDEAVKCWGSNSSGQLGDGTTIDQSEPVSVVGLTEPVAQVVVGKSHACALTTSGGVVCWGRNDDQRLGDPTFPLGDISTTPVSVAGLESGVSSLSAEWNHTCAVVNGAAMCWGRNDYGGLGNGSSGELVQVKNMTRGVVAVGAGAVHSCALMDTGIVNCWGAGWGGGGLGRGDAGPDGDPVPGPVANLTNAVAIHVTTTRTCAITADEEVKCWGLNDVGSFAMGVSDSRWYNSPQLATGYPNPIQITGGSSHTCALASAGTVRCSGSN